MVGCMKGTKVGDIWASNGPIQWLGLKKQPIGPFS